MLKMNYSTMFCLTKTNLKLITSQNKAEKDLRSPSPTFSYQETEAQRTYNLLNITSSVKWESWDKNTGLLTRISELTLLCYTEWANYRNLQYITYKDMFLKEKFQITKVPLSYQQFYIYIQVALPLKFHGSITIQW